MKTVYYLCVKLHCDFGVGYRGQKLILKGQLQSVYVEDALKPIKVYVKK